MKTGTSLSNDTSVDTPDQFYRDISQSVEKCSYNVEESLEKFLDADPDTSLVKFSQRSDW